MTVSDENEVFPNTPNPVKLVPCLSALRHHKHPDPTGTLRRWLHLLLGYGAAKLSNPRFYDAESLAKKHAVLFPTYIGLRSLEERDIRKASKEIGIADSSFPQPFDITSVNIKEGAVDGGLLFVVFRNSSTRSSSVVNT